MKKKRKTKAVTIFSISDYYNPQSEKILNDINDEYFKAQAGLKKDFILKAAKLLEEIGVPKKAICAELVQHIRFASERMIRKTLTPEYKDDSKISGTSAANEEKRIMEEDSRNVIQLNHIAPDEEPASPVYHRMQEKREMLIDERDYYRDQYEQSKNKIRLLEQECDRLKERIKVLEQQLLTIQK